MNALKFFQHYTIFCRFFCVGRHIRESEVYLSTGELLYNVIAVYIIIVLIKTSAELESHYNLLVLSCYLDHFFLSKFQISGTRVWSSTLIILLVVFCLFIFLFQTDRRHGVYIAAYDMQLLLLLLLYYLVSMCRKLFTGNLAITTWSTFYGYLLKLAITSATVGSKHNTIIITTLMQVLDVVTGTSK